MVTLNSDDPSMFDSWLTDEYAAARDAWLFTDADLADLARAAVTVSFADDDVKTTVTPGSMRGSLRLVPGKPVVPDLDRDPHRWDPSDIARLAVDPLERLARAIREQDATVAVVGLGYVGLPLLVALDRARVRGDRLRRRPRRRSTRSRRGILHRRRHRHRRGPGSDGAIRSPRRPAALRDADVIVMACRPRSPTGCPTSSMVRNARAARRARTFDPACW